MGCFGYLCKGCGEQIVGDSCNGGELCVLIHVRHGEEMGRTVGHYDEYGGVKEDSVWRKCDGVNSHEEICKSEFMLEDSYNKSDKKHIYNGEECSYYIYIKRLVNEVMTYCEYDINKSRFKDLLTENELSRYNEIYEELLTLTDDGDILKKKARLRIELEMALENSQAYWVIHEEFIKLPVPELQEYSGIVAWHKKCYDESENKDDLIPSEHDPNQSWGEPKEEFM